METPRRREASRSTHPARSAAPRDARASSRGRLRRMTGKAGTAFLLCFVLLAALFALRAIFVATPSEKKLQKYLAEGSFYNGVSVGGVNVSGMTLEEAHAAVLSSVEKNVSSINLTVRHENKIWVMTAADLKVQTDLNSALAEAMLYGRADTRFKNRKAIKALGAESKDFPVAYSADEAALSQRLAAIGLAVDTQPTEPSAEPDVWATTPLFTYTEGKDGYILDEAALAKQIDACLQRGEYDAVLDPQLVQTAPKTTMEEVLSYTQQRAIFQTSFGGSSTARSANRVGNIQKATTIINGAVVLPGEAFDFNEFVGPRTEAGGWPLAAGIINGNQYEMQAGGGICQVSTTLYNALVCAGGNVGDEAAPINVTERKHHSWPSSYVDRGLDATVSTGGPNLVFVNNMDTPLYLFCYCDQTAFTMTFYIYGAPYEAGVTYQTRGETTEVLEPEPNAVVENAEWPTGFEAQTITSRKGYLAEAYRDKYVDGVLQEGESVLLYTDRYRPVQGTTTIGTGDPSLPKPTLAASH